MSAAYYHSSELPWSTSLAEEKRFRLIATVLLALFVAICIVVPWINVPQPDRFESERVPPRLAKLVLKEKPKPPPPPPPKIEEAKPEPEKKVEEPKPEVKPEVKKETPPPDIKAAREKAAKSGLLAMKDELASLRQGSFGALLGGKPLSKAGEGDATRRSIITSTATAGSGGISTSKLSRDPGQTQLAARDTTVVESEVVKAEEKEQRDGRKPGRSAEQIQLVLDQNKGAIYALYHRALRSNPALQGKLVLEITITPGGDVSECTVVSSELKDEDLVRKLLARIKLFQFGAKNVDATVFTWPVDFLPSM